MTLAPALPLAVFYLLRPVGSDLFDDRTGSIVVAATLGAAILSFPVTWIAVPLLIRASMPEGRFSLRRYLLLGIGIGACLSLLYPPVLPIGVACGLLVSFGVWCCHWAFRQEERDTDPSCSPLH